MKKTIPYFIPLFTALSLWLSCQQPQLNPPANPQRIISLKPNLTEMLFALGAGDRVVGVTTHCLWPEAAKQLPKVGSYAFPDLEKILALKPDLIVTNKESSSPRFVALLRKAHIPVMVIETRKLGEIYYAMETLGSLLHNADTSIQTVNALKSRFAALSEQSQQKPSKRALVVIQRRPLIVAGRNSFISELLNNIGITNAVPLKKIAYPQLSMEEVLAWQPDVIFDLDPSSELNQWQQYQSLPAVKTQQIYSLSPNLFIPGPRIADAAEMVFNALHNPASKAN